MSSLEAIQWGFALTGLGFVVAFGCVCGSFINVVVYRLPRGMNLITPPSACPSCGTKLTWRENFPVLGWLWLRGRCRFCRSPISAEYPLVEAFVGALFGLIFMLWFMKPSPLALLGVDTAFWRPEWAAEGLPTVWPMLTLVFALTGSFVAATLVDAKTFTIPLGIPWFATAVALVVHPLHAAWVSGGAGVWRSTTHAWTIPVAEGPWLGVALGGTLGLVISIALLRAKVLPLSFADYEEWERAHTSPEASATGGAAAAKEDEPEPFGVTLRRVMFLTMPAVALMALGFVLGIQADRPLTGCFLGMAVGLLIGMVLRRLAGGTGEASGEPVWAAYPHARREVLKELLFLFPAMVLGGAGAWLAGEAGPLGAGAAGAPLWLGALGGALLGYLVAGGIVWAFRIGGTLALGREAMGLGDVHLMGAAGAALGWIDPTLAFFTAPFMGIAWAVLSVFFKRLLRQGTALPYGPHLAAATILVMLLKPLYESGLTRLLGRTIDLP